ncbi:hypothetical protein PIB30_005994 [Stylosanthes scabra]|uniref:Protein phosphatase inhibitor 2 n=1 Tax=Stylosanthes scabra TaxID=79078 RepID=A0ABU6T4Z5_9FABA|nr:hypothetical protein [Stylosanthes scabra]
MKSRVRWDEANIVEIESTKPLRQKITEPKTPYHPMIDDESSPSPIRGSFDACVDDEHCETNAVSAFDDAASGSGKGMKESDGWTTSEDEAEAMEQDDEDRNLTFKEHRKAHYDEFLKVKELRQKASLVEDESDEDNNTELTKGKGSGEKSAVSAS